MVEHAADELVREHGDLDILVNSGAQWIGGPLVELTNAQIAAMVDSMLTGTMALTRRLLPTLLARPRADIHTVVSMSGLRNTPDCAASVASFPRRQGLGRTGFVSMGLVEELRRHRISG